jgi:RNA polymerase sigma-70 factor (ECF subfamily)
VTTSDRDVVDALRAGDEHAFSQLVDRHRAAMLAVARMHVASREVAEDVVQDTWLAVLKGLDGFEGRSSLRTWLFRVLVNIAKTRGVRDQRTTPVGTEVLVRRADETPEYRALSGEALELVRRELDRLPDSQRVVVSLRDLHGLDADEVCALLDLTVANQRVLLHRGRARIRAALADYFEAAS